MYIKVLKDGVGQIACAGANIENPSDPNQNVIFDFAEMAILPAGHPSQGIFVNTKRVDHFGFPLQLRVQGLNGYDQTVGEPLTEARDSIFANFVAEVSAKFQGLAQAPFSPYRIVAPTHASFQAGGANANYLQPVIDAAWAKYRTQDLAFRLDNLGRFVGRVSGDVMRFTGANGASCYINGKPSTSMVMLGNGWHNDATGAADVGTQLQLQAQVSAAFNRGVFDSPANWHNVQDFYPASVASNQYARFWHAHSLQQLSYGFAYDNVGNQSPSLHTSAPTDVTLVMGWGAALNAVLTPPVGPAAVPGWALDWSDEFNGTTLSPSIWSFDTGAGGWGNNESQYYWPQNVSVKDGLLTITAKKESVGGVPYTSARIQTAGKKTFADGRLEMRAKLPATQGMWPAFWLLGQSCHSFGLYGGTLGWPACGEIDVMEMIGGLADGSGDFTTHGTFHYLNAANINPMPGFAYRSPTRLSADFHVDSVDWSPQGFTWAIDGVPFGTRAMDPDMTAFQKPFFLLLNLAVGGNWGGWHDASTVFPQSYVIDYARHYIQANLNAD